MSAAPRHDPTTIEVYLDAAERYHTMTVPGLRLIGFQLIAFLVVIHNRLVLDDPNWTGVAWFVAIAEAYCLASWVVLRR